MTDYYTCCDCGGYVLICGCPERQHAEQHAKNQRREASRVVTWYAVTDWGRSKLAANHEAEAVSYAQAQWGPRLKRLTKTTTETFWEAEHDL